MGTGLGGKKAETCSINPIDVSRVLSARRPPRGEGASRFQPGRPRGSGCWAEPRRSSVASGFPCAGCELPFDHVMTHYERKKPIP